MTRGYFLMIPLTPLLVSKAFSYSKMKHIIDIDRKEIYAAAVLMTRIAQNTETEVQLLFCVK